MPSRSLVLVLAAALGASAPAADPPRPVGCAAVADNDFENEVWAKVGVRVCLTCHKAGGDAADSKFVLEDPRKKVGAAQADAMRHNRDAFAKMARLNEKDRSRILLKVVGQLDHGGADVVKPDSAEYRTLEQEGVVYVKRGKYWLNAPYQQTQTRN